MVFKNPDSDFHSFDLDKDVALADKLDNHTVNHIDPNLRKFFERDGKLLMFHGWSDQLIPPLNSVNYYQSVVKTVGVAKTTNSIRLFMFPGMTHCGGGEGPNIFDAISTLSQWVEKGETPTNMIASHFTNNVADRTRPVCQYPQVAKYKGTGSIDDAGNFACQAP